MTSGIKHKPGTFRNKGNTLGYNINNTRAINFTMYFSITKSEHISKKPRTLS